MNVNWWFVWIKCTRSFSKCHECKLLVTYKQAQLINLNYDYESHENHSNTAKCDERWKLSEKHRIIQKLRQRKCDQKAQWQLSIQMGTVIQKGSKCNYAKGLRSKIKG